jgi:hypothetical protein
MNSELEKKLAALKRRLYKLNHKTVMVDVKGSISFLTMFDYLETWQEWNDLIFSSENEERYFGLDTNNIGNITMDIDDIWIEMKNGLSLMIYES